MTVELKPHDTETKPRYVLVNDEIHHVSDYHGLPIKDRPEAICPVCNERVIMRLGEIREDHFAHYPDSDCALKNPETAIHFNAKMHIVRILQNINKIYRRDIWQCCKKKHRILWVANWDDVQYEYRYKDLIPDITILKNGQVVACIEIVVTHAVDEIKANKYTAYNIPWIELTSIKALEWNGRRYLFENIVENKCFSCLSKLGTLHNIRTGKTYQVLSIR